MRGDSFSPPLIIHRGAIGDLIRLTAAARVLHSRWGRPCDVLAGRGPVEDVFFHLETIDRVVALRSQGTPYWLSPNKWRLLRWLKRRHPSPIYLLETRRRRFALRTHRTRIEWLLERAGIDRSQVLSMQDVPRRPLENAVDYLLRMAAEDPVSFAGQAPGAVPRALPRPELKIDWRERSGIESLLERLGVGERRIVLLQPVARRTNRGSWPESNWAELAKRILAADAEARILLPGMPQHLSKLERIRRRCDDDRVLVVVQGLGLRRFFALVERAHSMVSVDSGPAHAAAALNCPVVVLAGKADPRRNRPVGRPDAIRILASLPESDWPETAAAWWQQSDMGRIGIAPVLSAWSSLPSRDE